MAETFVCSKDISFVAYDLWKQSVLELLRKGEQGAN
jgi:hypothetical protein